MNGTMTENANRLFSMPKTVLATDSRIVMNQHGKYVRKHQWLGSDAAMAQYLSALLKYDFDRYFRKKPFRTAGRSSVQMSLFGMQETTALSVNRGRRPYTEKLEDWMKSGTLVMFEGQIGTVVFRSPATMPMWPWISFRWTRERSIWNVQPTISLSVKRISCFLRKKGICRPNRLPYASG